MILWPLLSNNWATLLNRNGVNEWLIGLPATAAQTIGPFDISFATSWLVKRLTLFRHQAILLISYNIIRIVNLSKRGNRNPISPI